MIKFIKHPEYIAMGELYDIKFLIDNSYSLVLDTKSKSLVRDLDNFRKQVNRLFWQTAKEKA